MSGAESGGRVAPGSTLGAYRITREIASGGMGTVYEGVHQGLKKRVAIKVLAPALEGDVKARERFLREGEAASRIRHLHVVDISDVGRDRGHSFLVMEYLEGETLEELLARKGRLDSRRAVDLMIPVVAAVAAGHRVGVIHRDLKPSNVILPRIDKRLHPKVVDFGIASVSAATDERQAASVIGTPAYIAPERLRRDGEADARSDQYSLGVMLYECLTGEMPFAGETLSDLLHEIRDSLPPRPGERRPGLNAALSHIVAKAMAKNPLDRFTSCMELGAALLDHGSERVRLAWVGAFSAVPHSSTRPPALLEVGPEGEAMPVPLLIPASPRLPARAASSPGDEAAEGSAPTPPAASPRPSAAMDRDDAADDDVAEIPGERLPVARIAAVSITVGLLVAIGAAYVAANAGGGVEEAGAADASAPAIPAEPETFLVHIETDPATATIVLDDADRGVGRLVRTLPVDGTPHTLRITAPGYLPERLHFVDTPPVRELTLEPLPEPTP